MESRSWCVAGIAATLVLALGACSGDDAEGVRVDRVGRADVTEVVEAPAVVSAKAAAAVTAPAEGRVGDLRVREGQRVRAGRVLLRLESPQARRTLREARRADAEAAESSDVTFSSGSSLSAQQEQADEDARRAFAAARRSARAIPNRQVRAQALAALDASQAQYTAARTQARDAVRRFEAGLGSLSEALSSLSSAQRLQTRAAVRAAERSVAALTVRAPITGTVSLTGSGGSAGDSGSGSAGGGQDLLDQVPENLRGQAEGLLGGSGSSATVTGSLAEGQPVRSGQVMLRVTDASTLSLTAQVDETDVLLVRPGVEASVELDAVPDATYSGAVATIDPEPASSSRGGVTYVVRLALGDGKTVDGAAAPAPRPGMSAVVGLRVRTATDAVAVPVSAIVRDGGRDAVWVVKAGLVARRAVRLGAQGEDAAEVVDGLEQGERIVVRGADRVRDGQRL